MGNLHILQTIHVILSEALGLSVFASLRKFSSLQGWHLSGKIPVLPSLLHLTSLCLTKLQPPCYSLGKRLKRSTQLFQIMLCWTALYFKAIVTVERY